MSRLSSATRHQHHTSGGLERGGPLLAETHPDLVVSKRQMRKAESIECVRLNREAARQNLGFSSRPFVLCGLPVKRPATTSLLHERPMVSSFFRSPGIRASVCPGGKTGWFRFFWPHSQFGSGLHQLPLTAPPRCWTPLPCNRAVLSIADWWERSSESSGPPFSSVRIPSVNMPQSFIARGLIS